MDTANTIIDPNDNSWKVSLWIKTFHLKLLKSIVKPWMALGKLLFHKTVKFQSILFHHLLMFIYKKRSLTTLTSQVLKNELITYDTYLVGRHLFISLKKYWPISSGHGSRFFLFRLLPAALSKAWRIFNSTSHDTNFGSCNSWRSRKFKKIGNQSRLKLPKQRLKSYLKGVTTAESQSGRLKSCGKESTEVIIWINPKV